MRLFLFSSSVCVWLSAVVASKALLNRLGPRDVRYPPQFERLDDSRVVAGEGVDREKRGPDDDPFAFHKGMTSVPKVPVNTKVSGDSFYVEPQNLGSLQPGTVIRMREVTREVMPKDVERMFQCMVRSTDSLNNPVGIVFTILVPFHGDGSKLLSLAIASDSPCVDCAPSVNMDDSLYKVKEPLHLGWFIIIPDFEGPKAAFGAGQLAGHALLDTIRGALDTGSVTGIQRSAKFGLWGYSGGSIAAGNAAARQPRYAPDLGDNLVGVALGGWITDYEVTIKANDGELTAGLVALAIAGLAQQYNDLRRVCQKYITDLLRLKLLLEETTTECLYTGVFFWLGTKFFKGESPYFVGGEKALKDPLIQNILEENRVASRRENGIPGSSLFLHHSTNDHIAPHTDTQRVIKNYCDWGINSFDINHVTGTDHLAESIEGVPAVWAWFKDRFDGKAPVSGCKEQYWQSLRDYPGIDQSFHKRADERALRKKERKELEGPEMSESDLDLVREFLPLP